MKEKGLAMTTAPNISADIIMHIGVDRFKGNWKDVIKACLKVATENSVTSIALPEFGTGEENFKVINEWKSHLHNIISLCYL